MKVKEIMTVKEVKYCSPETKMLQVVQLMKDRNCGALPVVDAEKKVIGMVTDRDIALSITEKESDISQTKIGDVISKNLYSVNEDANLKDALKQMRTNRVGRLPVVDKDGKLKGIISVHNLLLHSFKGDMDFGRLTDKDENIIKTVKAINDRYNMEESQVKQLV